MRSTGISLVASQAIGQLALVAVIPFLTRSFTPSEMGLFQVAMAAAVILQPIATLRIEFLVPVASTLVLRRLRQLARRATATFLIAGTLAAGILASVGLSQAAEIVTMATLITLGLAWLAVDNSLLILRSQLRRLAWRNALAGIATALLQLASARIFGEVLLLAVAVLAGRGLAVVLTMSQEVAPTRPGRSEAASAMTAKSMTFSVLAGAIAPASLHSLPVYLGAAFGTAAAGFAGIAQRAAGAPFGLIGQGLSQHTQSIVAPIVRTGSPRLRAEVRRQALVMLIPAVLVTIALVVAAPLLAEPVLGEGWRKAGVIMAILAPAMSLQLVVSPIMSIFNMLRLDALLFRLTFGRFLLALGAAATCGWVTQDLYTTVGVFTAAVVTMYGVMYLTLDRVAFEWDSARSAEEGQPYGP